MKKIIALLLLMIAVIGAAGCIGTPGTDDNNTTSPVPAVTDVPVASISPQPTMPVAPMITLANANSSATYTVSESHVNFAKDNGENFVYLYGKKADLLSDFKEFNVDLQGMEGGYVSASGKNFYIYVYEAKSAADADKAVVSIIDYYRSIYKTLTDMKTVKINGHDVLEVKEISNRVSGSEKPLYVWANGNAVIIIEGNSGTEDLIKELAEKSGF